MMKRTTWIVAATLLASVGCGPRYKPKGPSAEPSKTTKAAPRRRPAARPPAQEVLIGEMCPAAVKGRPGVMPVIMRRLSWTDSREEMAEVLERNMARQFSVLGWDGHRVGTFSVVGSAEGAAGVYAAGGYAGGSACETHGPTGETRPIPECEKTMLSCALSIAALKAPGGLGAPPFDEQPDPLELPTGGACVTKGKLLFDVDRDGHPEAFRTADFLDPFRAPAEEVSSIAAGKAKCEPHFAVRAALPATDPRDWRGLDILGVIDLDGDGRDELVAAYNYQTRRTWAIYSARSSSGSLDLVGEGVPWPRNAPIPPSSPLPSP